MSVIDPSLGACPAWCEKPAKHDWEDEWLNGPVRVHTWTRTVTPAARIRGDEIRLEETEQHTDDGLLRQRVIVVDAEAPTEWDLDTAVRARDVLNAAIALAAADGADAR